MSVEFKWTDDLAKEYAEQYRFSSSRISIDQFKESKQPKPEWEILSYLSDTLPDQYVIYKNSYNWNNAVLKNWPIHSVKRLSDSEIFTIGDKYRNDSGMKEYTIKEFEIRNGELRANAVEHGFDYFSDLIKVKSIILTTQDGVEILYGLLHVCSVGKTTFEISECRADLIQKGHHDHYFYFSCRAKAEEYILWNKPCLSLSEVLTRHSCVGKQDNDFIEAMKRLASNNLNNKR